MWRTLLPFGKLIGLLFCLLLLFLLSILFLKLNYVHTIFTRNELAHSSCNGNHFSSYIPSPLTASEICNKQFITLGHLEIWNHFTRTLYFHSPSARDITDVTHEISCDTRKMVPITGRASSVRENILCTYIMFQKYNRKEKEETEQKQTYQFTTK